MPRISAQDSIRRITGKHPIIPPVVSDADHGLLDPEQFIKEVHRLRRQNALGLPPPPGQEYMARIKVPTYHASLIKQYNELPKGFRRKAMKMFSEGCSETEVQAVFGISKKAWESWLLNNEEFADFITLGMAKAQTWWERHARAYVTQPNARFNLGLWAANMENRFGYKDRREVRIEERRLIGHVLLPPLESDPRLDAPSSSQ